jgi:hypothetical protein
MIYLDTNYLIGLPVKGSAVALHVDEWLAAGISCAVGFQSFLGARAKVGGCSTSAIHTTRCDRE